jgi:hypothetical protein
LRTFSREDRFWVGCIRSCSTLVVFGCLCCPSPGIGDDRATTCSLTDNLAFFYTTPRVFPINIYAMDPAPTSPPVQQTVFFGRREYEVVLPPIWTPTKGGVTLHPLNSTWALWAQKKVKKTATSSWYEGTVCLGRFDTVEGFWQLYSHICRPEMIQGGADLMLFRDGIRPVWEDEANKGGGKWTVRMKRQGASLVWEELLLSLVGEALDCSLDVCGAIISVRFQDNNISLWHRSADNENILSRLK